MSYFAKARRQTGLRMAMAPRGMRRVRRLGLGLTPSEQTIQNFFGAPSAPLAAVEALTPADQHKVGTLYALAEGLNVDASNPYVTGAATFTQADYDLANATLKPATPYAPKPGATLPAATPAAATSVAQLISNTAAQVAAAQQAAANTAASNTNAASTSTTVQTPAAAQPIAPLFTDSATALPAQQPSLLQSTVLGIPLWLLLLSGGAWFLMRKA